MKDLQEFHWGSYIIFLVLYFLQDLKKYINLMSLTLTPTLSLVSNLFVGPNVGSSLVFENLNPESSKGKAFLHDEESPREKPPSCVTCQENKSTITPQDCMGGEVVDAANFYVEKAHETCGILMGDTAWHEEEIMQEKMHHKVLQKGMHEYDQNCSIIENIKGGGFLVNDIIQGSDSLGMVKLGRDNQQGLLKLRKRPAMLVVPEHSAVSEFGEMCRKLEHKEFEVEGRDFVLASKKGRRKVMEDGYGVMVDILGDPKQAFFAVIDGHGGQAATDFVAENLGRNITKALECVGGEEGRLEQAIRSGYMVTDKDFLCQGVSSGACTSSVLLKDGELHVANVGDCRVVLSRKGVAKALTNDHRLTREDERLRIENTGGFVHCQNGIWRAQGLLAVSRAIGDMHLKEWIISEPEIKKLRLTSDCQFLIMASDGLWDKVNDQEAVDVVLREKNLLMSCKKLVDMSSSRGSMDDITVMVIDLLNFVTSS
ncbi:probable protein phosphatase 2C 2 [Quercus lobata]|nr:probable protein phosphatase 2C 2 [Quercus lobata]